MKVGMDVMNKINKIGNIGWMGVRAWKRNSEGEKSSFQFSNGFR